MGLFFPIIVQHYHLQTVCKCDRILLSRGGTRVDSTFATPATLLPSGNTQASNGCTQLGQIISKKFEKPLDKPHKVCYNEYVKRARGKQTATSSRRGTEQKPFSKMVKKLLTNPTQCGIIQVFQGNETIKGCDQRKKEVDYYG